VNKLAATRFSVPRAPAPAARTSTPLDRLVQKIDTKRSGNNWTAKCPAHEDRHASLSINEGAESRVLIKCHAGCDTEAVVAAMGMTMADLMPDTAATNRSAISNTYDYTDAEGNLLYQVVRFNPKDFRQRRPAGAGQWTWNLNGTDRVLYHLPDLRGTDPRNAVLVVEGEKDVDRLRAMKFIATCNSGGAGKWQDSYSQELRGRRVVILPDNDNTGHDHALDVARSLRGIAAEVRIVDLPGLPGRGDVSDWLNNGGDPDQLQELIRAATPLTFDTTISTPSEPVAVTSASNPYEGDLSLSVDDFIAQSQTDEEWLVQDCIPAAGLTFLAADPRSFKTMFVLQLARTIASSQHSILGFPLGANGDVLYVSEEGSAKKLGTRLQMMGTSLPNDHQLRVLHRNGIQFTDDRGMGIIRRALDRMTKPTLAIFDTYNAMSTGKENDNDAARDNLRALQRLITDYKLTVVVNHHLKKEQNTSGQRHGARLRGAGALYANNDAVIGMEREREAMIPTDHTQVYVETKDGEPQRLRLRWNPDTFLLTREQMTPVTGETLAAAAAKLIAEGTRPTTNQLHAEWPDWKESSFRRKVTQAVESKHLIAEGRSRATTYAPATETMLPDSEDEEV
jgi:hypothetical protein